MTGLAILLGAERAAHECYIQVAGKGLRISAPKLREADERNPTLHRAMFNREPQQDRGAIGALAAHGA